MDAPTLPPETMRRWRALRAPLPLRPGVASIAWAVAGFLAVMAETTYRCTPDDPCGADWTAPLAFGLVALAVVAPLLDPPLGAVSGAVLAPLGLLYDAEGAALVAVAAAFGVAGLLSVVSAVVDTRSRRERLALLSAESSGTVVQVPDEVLDRPMRTARLLVLVCGASVLAAAALGGWVASKASDERARERRAPVVDATVVSYDEGDRKVTLELAGRRDTIGVYGSYAPGETVRAWDLGDGLRLVGEPSDASSPGGLPVRALARARLRARRPAHVRAEVRALRLGAPAWTVGMVAAPGGLGVADPETFDVLLVVPVDVEAVAELLWPDGDGDDLDDFDDLDFEEETPVEDEDDEPVLQEVVVAGRLVPRGLVAVRVGERWVAPLELARTSH